MIQILLMLQPIGHPTIENLDSSLTASLHKQQARKMIWQAKKQCYSEL
jgi:hypothetical protein